MSIAIRDVREHELAAPGDDAALHAFVSETMSRPLDPSRPLWELCVVRGLRDGGHRSALLARVHHALGDGIASVKARANGVSGPSLDSTDITVRIDTQAPAAPTLVAPTVASTTSVIVSGIAGEAGRVDVTEGGAPRCSVTVDATGAWQCTIAFAETGTHLIVSAETDVAGNVGPQSTTESVTIQENLLADGFE